jgi:glycosyltransferase involved in cell wall biosynthesis
VSAPRRFLALEPYYGGSHRTVLDELVAALAPGGVSGADPGWEADLLTMPARKWKWRMRGSAIVMAGEARALRDAGARWDVVFASTFINLAEFRALAGPEVAAVPAVVYFHENQLVYPNRHTADWDLQFPLTNVVSALAADRCVFNTKWNLDNFLAEIPGFFKQFPDHLPRGVAPAIAEKSEVLAPPFDPAVFDAALGEGGVGAAPRGARPRIVWPHRWEHDKDPDTFFRAVTRLAEEGLDFEVAVAGQAFVDRPEVFATAQAALGDRLVHLGQPEGRRTYAELLATSDIAVSTAVNEFFGLAMMEAAYCGAYPLVPDRLAYRELYPERFRYDGAEQLVARLRALLLDRPAPGAARDLAAAYALPALAPRYGELFARVAGEQRG